MGADEATRFQTDDPVRAARLRGEVGLSARQKAEFEPLSEGQRMKYVWDNAFKRPAAGALKTMVQWKKDDQLGFQKRMLEVLREEAAAAQAAPAVADPAACSPDEKAGAVLKLVDDLLAEFEAGVRT